MKIQLLLIFLIVYSVNCQLKIVNLVGNGYDILKGNPKSKSGADPGFHSQIFQITYNQNRVSSSGAKIPDDIELTELNSYQFEYTQNEYTGMQSYQSQLAAQAKSDYDDIFYKASFTSNLEFNQVKTNIENSILIEANAKNELYTLKMNLFNMLPITEVFRSAIMSTLSDNSVWKKIFEQYGTHFIHKTIVGGRAAYQYKLYSRDYQELVAMGIDVKLAGSYKMFSASSKFSYNDRKVNAFKSKSIEYSMIYVGGDPPVNNDFIEWSKSVRQYPVPIQYELKNLSYLFTQKNFPSLDAASLNLLKDNYYSNVKDYCKSIGCYEPGPDRQLPKNIITSSVYTSMYGGSNGGYFQDSSLSNTLMRVKKVYISSGSLLDGIQFMLSDGVNTYTTAWHGGVGGGVSTFELQDDEYITQIEVRSGKYVDAVTFYTNKGYKSKRYGGGGGGSYMLYVGPYLVGMYGKSGKYIDAIGFISNNIIY